MQQADPISSAFQRELRVRASSPLLGRSYHQSSKQISRSPPPELPKLHKAGSISNLSQDRASDKYAFDTQSQRSLAFGVVEDMRGIGFPHLGRGSNAPTQVTEKPTTTTKRKPSRLDLSLLFPKPKPAAAPLLSPRRYTNSPSPVESDFSVKHPPNRLTKPRSKSNPRSSVMNGPIPEMPFLPPRRASQKPVDWFDVPLEKIIRLEDSAEFDEEEEEDEQFQHQRPASNSRVNSSHPVKEIKQPMKTQLPIEATSAKVPSATVSKRSSRSSTTVSRHPSRESRVSTQQFDRQVPPSAVNRVHGSLQSWQSEGDLRSVQKLPNRLLKKKSSSTFMSMDLSKNSVLSLSSSESESEDNNQADEDDGERILRSAAPSRGPRDSFATNDYLEPEICHAEAVVTTKGYALTRLDRANSSVSSVSSGSRSTARRPNRSRPDSQSSAGRSSVSGKMLGSSTKFNVPLIEEPEEQADEVIDTRRRRPTPSNSEMHSAKRRSRIIAVTRQEESLLEAMRLRNGRITPSIFNDISNPPVAESETDTNSLAVSSAHLSPDPVQTDFDTSFLRLSTAMRIPRTVPATLVEPSPPTEKESYLLSYNPASDSEQKNDNTFTASPRLSFANSETPSSSSTMGHASPITPTLPIYRFSLRAPPPQHAPPPIPEAAVKRHSRRRTDSSEAIVLDESEAEKSPNPPYPLWAVKWTRDPHDLTIVH